jgi:uridine kinase
LIKKRFPWHQPPIKRGPKILYARTGVDEPLYIAYKPDSQEVVGFRIEPSQIGRWDVAIDTFYKSSGGMIEALEEEGLIELLLNTTVADISQQITVPYDDRPDSFREQRFAEQTEEFKHFGLTEAMYQPGIDKINEVILPARDRIGVVMMAGVSAAGKSPGREIIEKSLALQGRHTFPLPMDNYFLSREQAPMRDGKYDFDNPAALDIGRFIQDVKALLEGKEVDIPYYDFKSGESIAHSGVKLRLEPGDVLMIDGIHALNPELTGFIENLKIGGKKIPQVRLFVDAPENVRLPRRLVRDWVTRDRTPTQTIAQWANVRYGEDTYIYPTMQYADIIIDTTINNEEFYHSELYSIFYGSLPQVLRDAELLNDAKLTQFIRNLIETCRPPVTEEIPTSVP